MKHKNIERVKESKHDKNLLVFAICLLIEVFCLINFENLIILNISILLLFWSFERINKKVKN